LGEVSEFEIELQRLVGRYDAKEKSGFVDG
jgi:hypothetical protein